MALTAGTILLVPVLALGMGVFIAGIRWLSIDRLWQKLSKRQRPFFVGPEQDLIVNQLYRYVQFHWHMVIAEVGLFFSWCLSEKEPELWMPVVLSIVVVIHLWAGSSILNHATERVENNPYYGVTDRSQGRTVHVTDDGLPSTTSSSRHRPRQNS